MAMVAFKVRQIFAFLLTAILSSAAMAQISCGEALFELNISDYLHSERPANQKVLQTMKSPVFQRFLKNAEVKSLAEQLHRISEPHLLLDVSWENSLSNIQKTILPTEIHYDVKAIFVREKGDLIATGSRTKSMNMEFPKILTAIFDAAKKDIQSNPQIQTFQLMAGNVVNPMLIKMLQDYGFQTKAEQRYVPRVLPMLDGGGPRTFPNFRAPLERPANQSGQNWFMAFEVQR